MRRERVEPILRQAVFGEFGAHFILGSAKSQRLALRQAIGDQFGVMMAEIFMRLHPDQKIARNDVGSLVEQLEKRVLAIAARLAPDNRRCSGTDRISGAGNPLAVRFHIKLLQKSGETVKPLVVRQDGVCRHVPDIAMPDADERH